MLGLAESDIEDIKEAEGQTYQGAFKVRGIPVYIDSLRLGYTQPCGVGKFWVTFCLPCEFWSFLSISGILEVI